MLCSRSSVAHVINVGKQDIFGGVLGVVVFFGKIKWIHFKEIQCKEPCWENKIMPSNVFRDEILMCFMLDLLRPFPEEESLLL